VFVVGRVEQVGWKISFATSTRTEVKGFSR